MIEQTPEGWWIVSEDSHIGKWVKELGRLNIDGLAQTICEYIRPGMTVIDIGANIGSHTIAYLETAGPEGKVIAYEPHPESFECLHFNCPSAFCYELAVGQSFSRTRLVSQPNVGASYLHDSGSFEVEVVSLDAHVSERNIGLIKIDAEGCESLILEGARDIIETCSPVLALEVNEGALLRQGREVREIREFLDNMGYSIHFFSQSPWDSVVSDIICSRHDRADY